jgi:hypothetical protein
MRTGLLWCDSSENKPLARKVKEAAAAYRAKRRFEGRAPDMCYVHPSALPDGEEIEVAGIRVVAVRSMLPHHFMVGKADSSGEGTGGQRQIRKHNKRRKRS